MQEFHRVGAAIDLRMRQLTSQGIEGAAIVDHMFGYMSDLQKIYNTASDETLADLCHRYPGFYQYASLMEAVSAKSEAMAEAGTHPYGDLPILPEPLKGSLEKLMASAAELERRFQSAVESGHYANHVSELTILQHQWADDLQDLVRTFQSSDVSLRVQALVQQVLKAMALRIERLGRE